MKCFKFVKVCLLALGICFFAFACVKAEPPEWVNKDSRIYWNNLSALTQAGLNTLRSELNTCAENKMCNADYFLKYELKRIHNFIERSSVGERTNLCKAIGFYPLSKDNEDEFWINTSRLNNFIGHYVGRRRLNKHLKKLSYEVISKNNDPGSSQWWTLRIKKSENQNIAFACVKAEPPEWVKKDSRIYWNNLSALTQAGLNTLRSSIFVDGKYNKNNANELFKDRLKKIHNFIERSSVGERTNLCKAIGFYPLSKDNEDKFWINTSKFKNFTGYCGSSYINASLQKLSYKSIPLNKAESVPYFLKIQPDVRCWSLREKISENQNIAFAAGGVQQLPLNVPALPAPTAQPVEPNGSDTIDFSGFFGLEETIDFPSLPTPGEIPDLYGFSDNSGFTNGNAEPTLCDFAGTDTDKQSACNWYLN